MHCAELRYVARDLLAKAFAQVMGEAHLRVRSCGPVYRTSEVDGRIVLKFGVSLDTL